MPRAGGPQLIGVGGRRFHAGVDELQGARHPPAVGGRQRRRGVRIAGGELGVQGPRAVRGEPPCPALARAGRRGRTQLEVGEGGAEVQAGAAHHDRPPACPEQSVDLRVGAAAKSPAEARSSSASTPTSRCSSRSRSAAVGAPVRISRPR